MSTRVLACELEAVPLAELLFRLHLLLRLKSNSESSQYGATLCLIGGRRRLLDCETWMHTPSELVVFHKRQA